MRPMMPPQGHVAWNGGLQGHPVMVAQGGRSWECLTKGDVKVTREIARKVTTRALDRWNLRDLVTEGDIARTHGEMYNFLKWKLGSPSAVCAQYVTGGYRHFELTYADEAAAILLGLLDFSDVGRPEIRLPNWLLEFYKATEPALTTSCAAYLSTSWGIPAVVAGPLCGAVAKWVEGRLPLVAMFIPKEFDVDNRLIEAAIRARRAPRPRREPEPVPELELKRIGQRFRAVDNWARQHGYMGGFPNFHQADYGQGPVYGTILIKREAADRKEIPATELGNPRTVEERFRAVDNWARRRGYIGGFPNFHEADYGQGPVYGAVLVRQSFTTHVEVEDEDEDEEENNHENHNDNNDENDEVEARRVKAADRKDILVADLGNPRSIDERFRAVHDYAVRHGYRGGFPNFHQADYGRGPVYGTTLLRRAAADWRDIPARELGF
ncbi:MAG: hypothetical protein ACOY94_26715 [Bacillota bacterium]